MPSDGPLGPPPYRAPFRAETRQLLKSLRPFIKRVNSETHKIIRELTLSKKSISFGHKVPMDVCKLIVDYAMDGEMTQKPLMGLLLGTVPVRVACIKESLQRRAEFIQLERYLMLVELQLRLRVYILVLRGAAHAQGAQTLAGRLQW